MPRRSTSHEIEDASRRDFASALPDSWVLRDKTSDYGVDAEIELFDLAGKSTGLLFYVQLRGTDDIKNAQKMSIKLDQLRYFYSLEAPTLIVRYCRSTKSIFVKWHFAVKPSDKEDTQKTMTIHFSEEERWNESTYDCLQKTMHTLRLTKNYRIDNQLELSVFNDGADTNQRFSVELALDKIVTQSKNIRMKRGAVAPNRIEVIVFVRPDAIKLAVDSISSITIELDDLEVESIFPRVAYALASLLYQIGLFDHARTLCLTILEESIKCPSADLAFLAVRALAERPAEMVRLALLNDLHTAKTKANTMFSLLLFQSAVGSDEHNNAMKMWFNATLDSIDISDDPMAAANMEYNLGNREKCEGNFTSAVQHYNHARKLYPEYMELEYFQRELAGCLFCGGRFNLSETLYGTSVKLGDDASLSLRLGDAHFFNGNFLEAEKAYKDSHTLAEGTPLGWETWLKTYLAFEMKRMCGNGFKRRPYAAQKRFSKLSSSDPDYSKHLNDIWNSLDPLHPLINFNFGIGFSRDKKYNEAFGHFLISAFSNAGDEEAWSCAAICAYNSGGELLLATLGAAVETCGMSAYRRLRTTFRDQGMPDQATVLLDSVVRELGQPGDPSEEFLKMASELSEIESSGDNNPN